ncbi:MAG: SDR family oxidoreductase [Candidatus Riflebacteria bacterium]|nr:SDR family oxidoreductase [Candidatus Riflebacteria bacterium]
MKILVTGGCGYVGTVLTGRLLEEGHAVTVVDAMWFGNRLAPHPRLQVVQEDVRQADRLPMRGQDLVIHLANVANDPCSDLAPKLSWETNALASMGLVEAAIAAGVGRFIYASSGSVYGVKEEPEVTEDLSLVPISDYNKTKMISERVLLSYRDRILLQIVRPATICGYSPRMRLDLSVNMLTMQALARGRITVFGGDQVRPNIHLRDMIGVYLHLIAKGEAAAGIYNAGFENLSIMEIARRVTAHVPAEIVVSPSNDPRSYRLSSQKLLATGFVPRFGVEDGIREVVEAFRSGRLTDDDICYNIRTMKKLPGLQ